MDAARNQPIDVSSQFRFVDLAAFIQRHDVRGENTG